MNLLFICECNLNRSPTFEKRIRELLKDYPGFEVKSAGTRMGYNGHGDILNDTHIKWADKIFVMDLEQEWFIDSTFPEAKEKVIMIGVSDQYDTDSPHLIKLIDYWFNKKFKDKEI